jgi:inorganic triphosphatase YgiF
LEIELKFQVPPAQREALRRAVATASAHTTRLQAVYADTVDRRLSQAGLALRLRKEGRVWVQTLKGRGDDLMSRLEHEVPLPPGKGMPSLDPQRHAGSPAGQALMAALADGAVLTPIYRTDIRRLHRELRFEGARVEVAYDQGWILAGDARLPVAEVEFELLAGPPAALVALARRWTERFGLWWDSRTKSERGHRLALGHTQVPALRAGRSVWPEGVGPDPVWRIALRSALVQALTNASEIASGTGGPEHLHQLRVGLRRTRTVLRELVPQGSLAGDAQTLEAAWREPFAALGAARDEDIVAGYGPALQAAGAPALAWSPQVPGQAAERVVRDPGFSVLMLRCLALTLVPAPAPLPERAAEADPLQAAVRAWLRPLWRGISQSAADIDASDPAAWHRLRKRLKRLRYLVEMLWPALPRKPAQVFQASLAQALQALGDLNDLQVAQDRWRRHADTQPQAWFAVGWLAAQRPAALAAATAALRALQATPRPWRKR